MKYIALLVVLISCKKNPEKPYDGGLEQFPWNIKTFQTDSILNRDSTWKKITAFPKTSERGEVLGLSNRGRNFFLEFDANKGFYKFTYLDSLQDFEQVNAKLTDAYGAPVFWDNKNMNRETKIWGDESMEIQLTRAGLQYVVIVERK